MVILLAADGREGELRYKDNYDVDPSRTSVRHRVFGRHQTAERAVAVEDEMRSLQTWGSEVPRESRGPDENRPLTLLTRGALHLFGLAVVKDLSDCERVKFPRSNPFGRQGSAVQRRVWGQDLGRSMPWTEE
jgi:hypothetical protein